MKPLALEHRLTATAVKWSMCPMHSMIVAELHAGCRDSGVLPLQSPGQEPAAEHAPAAERHPAQAAASPGTHPGQPPSRG